MTIVVGLLATTARADDEIALTWDAPSSCPSRDEVLAQVRKLTGPTAGASGLRAEVVITGAADGRMRARIRTEAEGMSGSRELDAPSCTGLSEAVVVLLALAANPYALTPPPAREAGPTPPPKPALEPARAPKFGGRAAPPPPPSTPWHLHASAVAVGDLGIVAAPTLGFGIALAVSRGWFRAEVQGTASSDRFIAESPGSGSGALIGSVSVTPRLCAGTERGFASFGACGGLEVVDVHGAGIGISHPRSGSAAWTAPELGVWVRQLTVSSLSVYAGVTGAVPLRRPEGSVAGVGTIYRPWVVTAEATLGLDLRIF